MYDGGIKYHQQGGFKLDIINKQTKNMLDIFKSRSDSNLWVMVQV